MRVLFIYLFFFNIAVLQVKKTRQISINYNANVLYACNVKILCIKT